MNNEIKYGWETLGVILRCPNPDSVLRLLNDQADVFVVFSKTSRLKIQLREVAF
jgi:hypothetical protein